MKNNKNFRNHINPSSNYDNKSCSQLSNIFQQQIDRQNEKIEYLQNLQNEINELTNKFN